MKICIFYSSILFIGLTSDELMTLLKEYKAQSFDPDTGKGFAYVYTQQNDKFKCIETVYDMFNDDNDDQGNKVQCCQCWLFEQHVINRSMYYCRRVI